MKRTVIIEENHKETMIMQRIPVSFNMVTAALSLRRNRQEHTINFKIAFTMKNSRTWHLILKQITARGAVNHFKELNLDRCKHIPQLRELLVN